MRGEKHQNGNMLPPLFGSSLQFEDTCGTLVAGWDVPDLSLREAPSEVPGVDVLRVHGGVLLPGGQTLLPTLQGGSLGALAAVFYCQGCNPGLSTHDPFVPAP